MNNEDEDIFKLPARFSFKAFKWICIWMCTVYPLLVGMVIAIFVKSGFTFTTLWICLLCTITGIAGIISVFGSSDIIIDNQGISRLLFGKIWQDIPWENVGLIKTYPLMDYNTLKKITAFNIFPSVGSSANSRWFNRIAFVEGAENMSAMLGIINKYVLKYNIKVESVVNGVSTTCTHL
jgi:hypothetical protein